nr:Tn3 family transposase [Streptomyces sp. CB02058]
MEDLIGVLGLVLDALVLFNARYTEAVFARLCADDFEVREEGIARLFPFVCHHINVLGRCSFRLPGRPGGLRLLRAPGIGEGWVPCHVRRSAGERGRLGGRLMLWAVVCLKPVGSGGGGVFEVCRVRC